MKKILINEVSICDLPRELGYTKSLLEDVVKHRNYKYEIFIKRMSFVNFIIYISLIAIDLRFGLKEWERFDLLLFFLIFYTLVYFKSLKLKMTISLEELRELAESGRFILPEDELQYISRITQEKEELSKKKIMVSRNYAD